MNRKYIIWYLSVRFLFLHLPQISFVFVRQKSDDLLLLRLIHLLRRVRHKGAENSIPQHNVLPIVTAILPMVEVMRIHVVDEWNPHIMPCVVQTRQRTAYKDKHQECDGMQRAKRKHTRRDKHGQQVIVLPCNVLEWVHVDSILVPAEWGHLPMVVLVDIAVQRGPVQGPVEQRVEEVVHNEEEG